MKKYLLILAVFIWAGLLTACFEEEGSSLDDAIAGNKTPYLLVLNVDGTSEEDPIAPESVGDLPKMVDNFSKKVKSATSEKFKALRDLPGLKNNFSFTTNKSLITNPVIKTTPKIDDSVTTYSFNAMNSKEEKVIINATRVYNGSKCIIFAETTSLNVASDSLWKFIGQQFDNDIYSKVTEFIGVPTDVDKNERIIILYYNMDQDGGKSGICGFFFTGDLYSKADVTYSNEMEIFYMNLGWPTVANPLPAHSEMIRTLAHEFQHMINFGQRVFIQKKNTLLDTWIDEGMAESAEHYALGTAGASRIDTYNEEESPIWNGASMTAWNGEVDNYAQVYVFMQYLRLQAADWTIFKDLIATNKYNYKAILELVENKIPSIENAKISDEDSDTLYFGKVLKCFRLAVLLNKPTGTFGFKDESETFDIKVNEPSENVKKMASSGTLYFKMSSNDDLASYDPSGHGKNIEFVKVKASE